MDGIGATLVNHYSQGQQETCSLRHCDLCPKVPYASVVLAGLVLCSCAVAVCCPADETQSTFSYQQSVLSEVPEVERRPTSSTLDLSPFQGAGGKPQESLVLQVYGLNKPSQEFRERLAGIILRKLDATTVDSMCSVFARNQQLKLTVEDVEFLQPDRKPSHTLYLPLPLQLPGEHRHAFLYYFLQTLSSFAVRPLYASSQHKQLQTHQELQNAYLVAGQQGGHSDHLFLYIRPQTKGRGMAVLCISLADDSGCVHAPQPGVTLPHPLLEGTMALEEEEEVVVSEEGVAGGRWSIRVHVWEKGNIGLEEFMQKLSLSCQHTILDYQLELILLPCAVADPVPSSLEDLVHNGGAESPGKYSPKNLPSSNSKSSGSSHHSSENISRKVSLQMPDFRRDSAASSEVRRSSGVSSLSESRRGSALSPDSRRRSTLASESRRSSGMGDSRRESAASSEVRRASGVSADSRRGSGLSVFGSESSRKGSVISEGQKGSLAAGEGRKGSMGSGEGRRGAGEGGRKVSVGVKVGDVIEEVDESAVSPTEGDRLQWLEREKVRRVNEAVESLLHDAGLGVCGVLRDVYSSTIPRHLALARDKVSPSVRHLSIPLLGQYSLQSLLSHIATLLTSVCSDLTCDTFRLSPAGYCHSALEKDWIKVSKSLDPHQLSTEFILIARNLAQWEMNCHGNTPHSSPAEPSLLQQMFHPLDSRRLPSSSSSSFPYTPFHSVAMQKHVLIPRRKLVFVHLAYQKVSM